MTIEILWKSFFQALLLTPFMLTAMYYVARVLQRRCLHAVGANKVRSYIKEIGSKVNAYQNQVDILDMQMKKYHSSLSLPMQRAYTEARQLLFHLKVRIALLDKLVETANLSVIENLGEHLERQDMGDAFFNKHKELLPEVRSEQSLREWDKRLRYIVSKIAAEIAESSYAMIVSGIRNSGSKGRTLRTLSEAGLLADGRLPLVVSINSPSASH